MGMRMSGGVENGRGGGEAAGRVGLGWRAVTLSIKKYY